MKKKAVQKKKKAGFTLVELMVVAIIVAILAAVAIPLMSANKTRAMVTEAEAGLGTARSALRAMYAETGDYTKDINGNTIAGGDLVAGAVSGISTGDLDGRFFSDESYKVKTVTASTYTLEALGTASTALKKADVAGVEVTLNEEGTFIRTGL